MNKNPKYQGYLSWKKLGNHTLILDSRVNKEAHHLNEIGSSIWSLCDGNHSVEDITKILSKTYNVSSKVLLDDVKDYIANLRSLSLLEDNHE